MKSFIIQDERIEQADITWGIKPTHGAIYKVLRGDDQHSTYKKLINSSNKNTVKKAEVYSSSISYVKCGY